MDRWMSPTPWDFRVDIAEAGDLCIRSHASPVLHTPIHTHAHTSVHACAMFPPCCAHAHAPISEQVSRVLRAEVLASASPFGGHPSPIPPQGGAGAWPPPAGWPQGSDFILLSLSFLNLCIGTDGPHPADFTGWPERSHKIQKRKMFCKQHVVSHMVKRCCGSHSWAEELRPLL